MRVFNDAHAASHELEHADNTCALCPITVFFITTALLAVPLPVVGALPRAGDRDTIIVSLVPPTPPTPPPRSLVTESKSDAMEFVGMGVIPASCWKKGSQRRWLKAPGVS